MRLRALVLDRTRALRKALKGLEHRVPDDLEDLSPAARKFLSGSKWLLTRVFAADQGPAGPAPPAQVGVGCLSPKRKQVKTGH